MSDPNDPYDTPPERERFEPWPDAVEPRPPVEDPSEPGGFPRSVARADTTIAALDSTARPHFARLLADARSAGFRVKVVETRRSPERQAYLITLSQHLTHTATSRHSDG